MRQTVVILGGGIGGLSTAHELAERGFEVRVFESKPIFGGKARSIPVPNSVVCSRFPRDRHDWKTAIRGAVDFFRIIPIRDMLHYISSTAVHCHAAIVSTAAFGGKARRDDGTTGRAHKAHNLISSTVLPREAR